MLNQYVLRSTPIVVEKLIIFKMFPLSGIIHYFCDQIETKSSPGSP